MLSKLFTYKNIEILNLLKTGNYHLRDIANNINCSVGKVHSALKLFHKYNLVNTKKYKNTKVFNLNRSNPLLKKLISLININKLISSKNFKKLSKFGPIGVYGSFSEGTDDRHSDLDLWLFTNKKLLELQPILSHIEKELKIELNLLILNNNKLNNIKQNDYEFYIRLKLTSTIFGDDIFD